jgi:peptidoglycan hydrolase-like protein with peptidoglycan-binding domain
MKLKEWVRLRARRLLVRARRPQVLVSGGLVALATGIAANALFLQSGHHPAPLFLTRAAADQPQPAGTAPDPDTMAVQTALRQSGHYSGPIDGIAGPQTEKAIAAFAAETGRDPLSESAPRDPLAALLSNEQPGAPPTTASLAAAPAAPAPPLPQPDQKVAAVQDALSRAAYGPLRADGLFGPQTREAIARFQSDRGLAITGEIDDALLGELQAAGALAAE